MNTISRRDYSNEVRSHVSSSMVLPHNATGFSDTIKIMPNGSAAEIGRSISGSMTNVEWWLNNFREFLYTLIFQIE